MVATRGAARQAARGEDLPIREVAALLGCSEGTVKSQSPPTVTEEATLRLADDFADALRDVGAAPGQGVISSDADDR